MTTGNGHSRIVIGACPHDCPDTCAVRTEVQDGVAVAFGADNDHPITQGWLCAKVRPYLERVYHPDRLQYPLRRVGPKGGGCWERISWAEAMTEISQRWKAIIAEDGASAILPYSYSGTLGLLQNLVAASRLFNRMGASGLERSICDAAATEAVLATLGAKWAPDSRDVAHSRLVLIWGHNPASTSPHFMPFLRQAQRDGTSVIVIDPRRTLTARSADLYVQPKPSTDAALALAMTNVIFKENLHDEAWLDANTVGWRDLRDRVRAYPPERAAEITGVPADTIVDLARRFATSKPSLLKFADGVQRHGNGGQTVRALLCLATVTGQIGVRGGGVFYSTSGYVIWDEQAVSHAEDCPPPPRIVNMVRLGAALTGEVDGPPIRSLFVFNANPVASTPNASRIIEGLMREDLFTVVHELFMTDTARYADIVLPATSQLEQMDLHKGYGHRFLQFNHPAIAPLGECRSNWDMMRELAVAMGYDDWWLRQSPEEVLTEVVDATRATNPWMQGITLERLMEEGTVPLDFSTGSDVPFADLRFPTPSGKVELYSERMIASGVDPLPEYAAPAELAGDNGDGSLVLISGAAHHYVSSSLANVPSLLRREGTPSVEIHPVDALRRGIDDGDMVSVSNERGSCQLRAIVTPDVLPGVVVSPKGHWAHLSPDGRNVNWITPDALADLGNQSTFHSNRVQVNRVDGPPDWRANRSVPYVSADYTETVLTGGDA
jgi:anaerobic selenocysteine-containing dehydrogenase